MSSLRPRHHRPGVHLRLTEGRRRTGNSVDAEPSASQADDGTGALRPAPVPHESRRGRLEWQVAAATADSDVLIAARDGDHSRPWDLTERANPRRMSELTNPTERRPNTLATSNVTVPRLWDLTALSHPRAQPSRRRACAITGRTPTMPSGAASTSGLPYENTCA